MAMRTSMTLGGLCLIGLLMSLPAVAEESAEWDQATVTKLAGELHAGVKGLRDEVRSSKQDIGTLQASAHYRLLDNLRLIERETRYLHQALESGKTREETLAAYARIGVLRRDCAEEMRRLFIGADARERIVVAQSIVKQMDPYYGFDPSAPDHERVLRR